MPHSREVRATSHDDHDPMLVAALAADDLAADDRDQAIALIQTCPDCATLRDDLVALARATASVPPPIASPARDYRLSPADAARLRPTGWRRFFDAVAGSRAALVQPLGAGLATLGLAGLLLGNVSLGSSAGAAPAAAGSAAENRAAAPAAAADGSKSTVELGAVPAASAAAPAPVAASAAASTLSDAHLSTDAVTQASSAPASAVAGAPQYSANGGPAASSEFAALPPPDNEGQTDQTTGGGALLAAVDDPQAQPIRIADLLFGGALVVGIALVAWSIVSRRRAT